MIAVTKRLSVLLKGIAALLILAAPVAEAPAASTGAVKLGVCLPMTGAASQTARKLHAGISIAHAMKPATASGIAVQLVVADTAGDPKRSAEAAVKLIDEEGVSAIIGEADTAGTLAASDISEEKKIPMVTPAVTAPALTESRDYLFRSCFSDSFQAEAIARHAMETLEARRAAVLIDINRDSSSYLADVFKKCFVKLGGEIVSIAYCASGDRDFTVQISSLMAAKPNFLFFPLSQFELIQACKKASEAVNAVPVFTIAGLEPARLIDAGGAYVEGLHFFGHFSPQTLVSERDRKYAGLFKTEKGYDPGVLEILGGDAYFLILDAIERAQSAEGPAIRDALAQTQMFPGLSGSITLGENGDARKSAFLFHIKGSRISYLKTLGP